ncbi:MAG: hypothetical protein N2C14_09240, partial [Planctomycetales bacterium]
RDWRDSENAGNNGNNGNESTVLRSLRDLAEKTEECFLVDVGSDATGNLSLVSVASQDKNIVAGVPTRFEVSVHNFGTRAAHDVRVKFTPEGSISLSDEIESIPPGQSRSAPFTFTFASLEDPDATSSPIPIRVEINVAGRTDDRLAADNTRFYAARVARGIPTLLVDGDPSNRRDRSETYFLRIALAPRGASSSGIVPTVINATEFESRALDAHQVVFLCNPDRVGEQRRKTLEKWVRSGGGLVILLGDQLFDVQAFNDDLYNDGKGLSPARLVAVRGDETNRRWVGFHVRDPKHDVLKVYQGDANPFLEGVKIFRWWRAEVSEDQSRIGRVAIPAAFTDPDSSPAVVEQAFGKGRVMLITTPPDRDWSNWPQDPSFLLFMNDLTRYVARQTVKEGQSQVGQRLEHPLDLTAFRMEAVMTRPDDEQVSLQATPVADAASSEHDAELSEHDAVWSVQYEEADLGGFYSLQLTTVDDEAETVLFAANLDSAEGDLTRADRGWLEEEFKNSPVKIISGTELTAVEAGEAKAELSMHVLCLLLALLFGEQLLARTFGFQR